MGNLVTQRPLTLPRTLADFVVKSSTEAQVSPHTWLVSMVERSLDEFEKRSFDKSRVGSFSDMSVKLIVRFPSFLDDRLDQFADKMGTSANVVIYQILLSAFEESQRKPIPC